MENTIEKVKPGTILKMMIDTAKFKLLDNCRADEKAGRESLTYLHVREGAILEVTDGKILCRLKNEMATDNFAPGVYKIIAVNKWSKVHTELTLEAVDCPYPNTDAVIPSGKDAEGKELETLKIRFVKKDVHAVSIVRIFKFNGSCVSEKYLDMLGELSCQWDIFKTEANKALLFNATGSEHPVTIVLMPMSLGKED